MKQLAFDIAQKIATNNKCPHTVYICTAILKDVFIKEGYTDFQSNTIAVD